MHPLRRELQAKITCLWFACQDTIVCPLVCIDALLSHGRCFACVPNYNINGVDSKCEIWMKIVQFLIISEEKVIIILYHKQSYSFVVPDYSNMMVHCRCKGACVIRCTSLHSNYCRYVFNCNDVYHIARANTGLFQFWCVLLWHVCTVPSMLWKTMQLVSSSSTPNSPFLG